MKAPVLVFTNPNRPPLPPIAVKAALLATLDPRAAAVMERLITSTITAVQAAQRKGSVR